MELHVQRAEGCWDWTGQRDSEGYGVIKRSERLYFAHRAFYEVAVGPIPAGLTIDHLCRNRACVNPSHLEPVTNRENLLRSWRYRQPARRCAKGHEFTPENTIIEKPRLRRRCRTCRAVVQGRWNGQRPSRSKVPA